jgi:hypothetical protein
MGGEEKRERERERKRGLRGMREKNEGEAIEEKKMGGGGIRG